MSVLSSLDDCAKEAVACAVAFQRLGFELGAIGAGVDGDGVAFVTLHHGGEQFNVTFGKLSPDIAPDVYVGKWREAVRAIDENVVNNVELEELLQRSMIWVKMEDCIKTLITKGFLRE